MSSTQEKAQKKIEKMIKNLDVAEGSELFKKELANAMAARDAGLTFKEISNMLEDRIGLLSLEEFGVFNTKN
jgi:hypothetical protein